MMMPYGGMMPPFSPYQSVDTVNMLLVQNLEKLVKEEKPKKQEWSDKQTESINPLDSRAEKQNELILANSRILEQSMMARGRDNMFAQSSEILARHEQASRLAHPRSILAQAYKSTLNQYRPSYIDLSKQNSRRGSSTMSGPALKPTQRVKTIDAERSTKENYDVRIYHTDSYSVVARFLDDQLEVTFEANNQMRCLDALNIILERISTQTNIPLEDLETFFEGSNLTNNKKNSDLSLKDLLSNSIVKNRVEVDFRLKIHNRETTSRMDTENRRQSDNIFKDGPMLTLMNNQTGFTPILTKSGYFCQPDIELLRRMSLEQLRRVEEFEIFNEFGAISFPGQTDLTYVNLDLDVIIKNKQVEVYPEDQTCNLHPKPAVGQKLNKVALITFNNALKKESYRGKDMIEHIKDMCRKNGTKFISYAPEDNRLVFQVEHFSKYSFLEDEEEETTNATPRYHPQPPKKPDQSSEPVQKNSRAINFNLRDDDSDNSRIDEVPNRASAALENNLRSCGLDDSMTSRHSVINTELQNRTLEYVPEDNFYPPSPRQSTQPIQQVQIVSPPVNIQGPNAAHPTLADKLNEFQRALVSAEQFRKHPVQVRQLPKSNNISIIENYGNKNANLKALEAILGRVKQNMTEFNQGYIDQPIPPAKSTQTNDKKKKSQIGSLSNLDKRIIEIFSRSLNAIAGHEDVERAFSFNSTESNHRLAPRLRIIRLVLYFGAKLKAEGLSESYIFELFNSLFGLPTISLADIANYSLPQLDKLILETENKQNRLPKQIINSDQKRSFTTVLEHYLTYQNSSGTSYAQDNSVNQLERLNESKIKPNLTSVYLDSNFDENTTNEKDNAAFDAFFEEMEPSIKRGKVLINSRLFGTRCCYFEEVPETKAPWKSLSTCREQEGCH